ncbi:MAG TPA: Ivy family c-type lysozyme inhibitor [Rhodanobacteraceae bacterium]|jgi:hypothetical protein|nr:Ivy family c-type lysozyme inhibitor [Rhodanobacteraceae bacterium]
MKQMARLIAVMVFGAACAACSKSQAPAAPPVSSAPPASAIPLHAPAASASADAAAAAPANGPSLAKIMQRPGFAQAFAAMDGAVDLPAWARQGHGDAPSQRVEVDGKTQWLAQACEAQACQSGELLVLIDPAAHAMQGVLVQQSGDAGASVRQLKWLGKPGAEMQAFLKGHLAHE